jgi:hypothetical protein
MAFAVIEREGLAQAAERNIRWLLPWPLVEGPSARVAAGRAPREDFELFLGHDPGDAWESAWRSSFAVLRAFRDESARLRARLLVVVVPSVHQVQRTAKGISLDVVSRLIGGHSLDEVLDWNLPERRLAGFFDSEEIDYVMLLPELRKAAGPGRAVYSRDEHLGPRGHEIAAEAVLGWLLREREVSRAAPPSGRPKRLLPGGASAPSLLDLGEDPHIDALGEGWLDWKHGTGWSVGWRNLVVVPAGSGDFIVRGRIEQGAGLPISGEVEIVGRVPQPLRASEAGAFDLRLSGFESPPAGSVSDGYVPVLLKLDSEGRAGRTVPSVTIREIGFEQP